MKWTTIYLDIFPALQFVPLVETMMVTFVVEWLSVGCRPSLTLFFFIFLFEGNKTKGVLNMKLPTWVEKEGYWSSQFWKESKDPAPHFSQEIIRIISRSIRSSYLFSFFFFWTNNRDQAIYFQCEVDVSKWLNERLNVTHIELSTFW